MQANILGIPFHTETAAETLSLLLSFLNEPANHIVTTPNPEAVMQARRNPVFMSALLGADLRLADGTGILLASRLVKGPQIPERVRGYDTCIALFDALSRLGRVTTVYLLGGAPGVAKAAKGNIESKYPAVKVIGLCDGYLTPEKENNVLNDINAHRPEILLVCMGMPRQEIWAHKHRALPVRLTLCLGGTLDVLAGITPLAPVWMRKAGLEWLYRLIRQPARARRMLDLPRFALAVLRQRTSFRKAGE
jgi:N-acetylglucosaminyldiphosphoundecaprenol N-acetyl-beta-D-mannosaminyltransferase